MGLIPSPAGKNSHVIPHKTKMTRKGEKKTSSTVNTKLNENVKFEAIGTITSSAGS